MRKYKYKKLTLLIITFIIAYLIFHGRNLALIKNSVLSLGYPGIFFSGILLSYGFTAAPATSLFLIIAKAYNPIVASLIGGVGALLGDVLIFQFIRTSLKKEINWLSKEKIFKPIKKIPKWLGNYLIPVFASFIIASPLPDEIGVSLLASSTKIPFRIFAGLSFLLNTAGILVILLIGRAI